MAVQVRLAPPKIARVRAFPIAVCRSPFLQVQGPIVDDIGILESLERVVAERKIQGVGDENYRMMHTVAADELVEPPEIAPRPRDLRRVPGIGYRRVGDQKHGRANPKANARSAPKRG